MRTRIISFASLLVIALLVVSCAPAGAPTEAQQPVAGQPEATVVVTREVRLEGEVGADTQIPAATEAPAVAEAPAVTDAPIEPSTLPAQPTAPPPAISSTVAPLPTQPAILPTPHIEAHLVELEWPDRLRLGDSDVVRLALIPSEEGYQVVADFPEHQTDTRGVQVERIAGYDLWAVARLDAVGFQLSPQGEQARLLPQDERVTWVWTLRPLAPGQQRLSVALLVRWVPAAANAAANADATRQAEIYSRGLDVAVSSFFGLSRGQAMTGGFLGLLVGGGLCLLALVYASQPSRPSLEAGLPNPDLTIELAPGIALPDDERRLLQVLFRRYARLVLELEFLSGYSGARTFLAQPIRPDSCADAYTIVKIGQREAIQQEYVNYQHYVKNTLPPVTARIQGPPVIAGKSARPARKLPAWLGEKACLQYTFIAEPGRVPASMRLKLLADPDPALLFRLFDTFGPNWWMQRKPYTFRLAQEYDRLLPTHYVIQPERGRGVALDGRTPPTEAGLRIGDRVILRNFSQVELRLDGGSLSLKGQPSPGQPRLRARWLGLTDPHGATGRVVATRNTLLGDYVEGFDLYGMPDPLESLPALLNDLVSGTQSTIHGDLNLENMLVGPGDFIWLIDFATTREGHPLYDFAHLEAEIIAHVIAPQLDSPADFLNLLEQEDKSTRPELYALLAAVREIAARCLFNSTQPDEYHLAALMASLGALKFANLVPFQKHLLYLNAAHIHKEHLIQRTHSTSVQARNNAMKG
jgi:hypothetical protein